MSDSGNSKACQVQGKVDGTVLEVKTGLGSTADPGAFRCTAAVFPSPCLLSPYLSSVPPH